MKITKPQLKKIIREERSKLAEASDQYERKKDSEFDRGYADGWSGVADPGAGIGAAPDESGHGSYWDGYETGKAAAESEGDNAWSDLESDWGYKGLYEVKITKQQIREILEEEWAEERNEPVPTEAELILNKFYVDMDALAASVGFIPLSREPISDRYTLEDYISDLSHQLRARR
tara:strand:+ start:974 stop:1498 length:525 start_codon:yes stop_codon:yes gene_type:complete